MAASPALALEDWPGTPWQEARVLTHLDGDFRSNLSGSHFNARTNTLWVCTNGPARFWSLVSDGAGGMRIGAKFNGAGDLEGITQADLGDQTVYIIDEARDIIRHYDVSDPGNARLLNNLDLSAHLPAVAGWAGSEGLTFVPDAALANAGFVDGEGRPYVSRNGMNGLMFIAHQSDGALYAFDLNPATGAVGFVGRYRTLRGESSGLEFDRSTGHLYVWHNTGGNTIEVSDLTSSPAPGGRQLNVVKEIRSPKGGNLESIALSPQAEGDRWVFFTDDDNQNGAALMWFKGVDTGLGEPPEPPPPEQPRAIRVRAPIQAGADDVEELAGGLVVTKDRDLQLGVSGGPQTVGLRFADLGIPKDAEVVAAHIQFTAVGTGTFDSEFVIEGRATPDAGPFSTATFGLSARPRTEAAVAWVPAEWTRAEAGLRERSAEVTSIVQELVGQRDWRSGNAAAFIITGQGKRIATAFERDPAGAAVLVVDYLGGEDPAAPPGPAIERLEFPLVGSGNDVEQRADGSIYTNSSDLELVHDGGAQTVGLRFEGVTVPPDAEIVDAYIQFTTDEARAEETSLAVQGVATGDAAAFATKVGHMNGLRRTWAKVPWAPAPWGLVNEAGPDQQTPALNPILQELVLRPDYDSGSAMAFLITGSGRRVARAFVRGAAQAPRLVVEYIERARHVVELRIANGQDDVEQRDTGVMYPNSSDIELGHDAGPQQVGLRFGVDLPAGAQVTRAWIQFTADEVNVEPTRVLIRALHGAGPAFGAGVDDLGARPRTSAGMNWSIPKWSSAGESGAAQRTPDLRKMIQEVLDGPDYRPGSPLMFQIAGSGRRTAEAFEGDRARAPQLHLEYLH